MKNIFRYVSISLITSMIVACSAAPPAQPDPTQTAEVPVPIVQPEPEPAKEPEKPVEPVKQAVPAPAPKKAPAKPVPQVKKTEIAPVAKTPEPVKKEPEEPAKPAEPEQAPEPVVPAAIPEPIVETKPEPVAEPKPVEEKNEVIAEFEGVQITKETYNQTKTEMEKIVDKLNRITATKDYNQWISFLSAEYRQQYSQTSTLKMVSEALPVKGIKLKSLKDYFSYVFVPSRQNVRVDDIQFVSPTRVNVIMKQGNVSLLIYGIENINGSWKLMPPKL